MNQDYDAKKEELNRAVAYFMERNEIPNDTKEIPVKNFKRKMGAFISNKLISDKEEIRNFLICAVRDKFIYYTKDSFTKFFSEIYIKLEKELDKKMSTINECYISNICGRDTSVHNSSNNLVTFFKDVARLDNSFIISFDDVVNNQLDHKNKLCKLQMTDNKRRINAELIENEKKRYEEKISNLTKKIEKRFKGKKYLILVDDVCGSGTTFKNYVSTINPVLPKEVIIIFICVHIMKSAENEIELLGKELDRKIKVYSSDKSQNSGEEIFDSKKMENIILNFEENIDSKYALGYKKSKALVANYENCPNNTLCCFWYSENKNWNPLFRRAIKQKDAIKTNEEKNEYINKIKYSLGTKGVDSEEFWLYIILLMVNEMKDASSSEIQLALKDKFFYNEDKLQECCDLEYLKEVSDDDIFYTYSLTSQGKDKLKEYNLSHSKLDKLFKKSDF